MLPPVSNGIMEEDEMKITKRGIRSKVTLENIWHSVLISLSKQNSGGQIWVILNYSETLRVKISYRKKA